VIAPVRAVDARSELVRVLRLDAIGPDPDDPEQNEALPQAPSEWYLTGFLVPYQAKAEDRQDPTSNEDVDQGGTAGGAYDAEEHEKPSARRAFLPSSIGVSVLVPAAAESLEATVTWGNYRLVEPEKAEDAVSEGETRRRGFWQRTPRTTTASVPVRKAGGKPIAIELPESDGLRLSASVREIFETDVAGDGSGRLVPPGTRAVSVFVVNDREPVEEQRRSDAMVFQAALRLRSREGFVARPNLAGLASDGWDERVADLQYRDCFEWAVGHGVATRAVQEARAANGVQLSMEALAGMGSAAEVRGARSRSSRRRRPRLRHLGQLHGGGAGKEHRDRRPRERPRICLRAPRSV
jgi:hypothetical protein